MEGCRIRLRWREGCSLCLKTLLVWFFPSVEVAGGPPAGLRGGAWAGSPGLSPRPAPDRPARAAGLRAAGLREEPAVPPAAGPDVRGGRGGGASFLSETYGIRQEFGPPRFKKTNKGKIVREGPPRAAAPPHCPPRLPPGRPGLPAGAEPEAGGVLPRVVPGGLPFPGPLLTCHLPVSGARERSGPPGWLPGGAGAPRRNHSGQPSASGPPSAEPYAQRPGHQASFGGELSTAQVDGGAGGG